MCCAYIYISYVLLVIKMDLERVIRIIIDFFP